MWIQRLYFAMAFFFMIFLLRLHQIFMRNRSCGITHITYVADTG